MIIAVKKKNNKSSCKTNRKHHAVCLTIFSFLFCMQTSLGPTVFFRCNFMQGLGDLLRARFSYKPERVQTSLHPKQKYNQTPSQQFTQREKNNRIKLKSAKFTNLSLLLIKSMQMC